MPERIVASTCKECSVRCGSLIHVDGDTVTRIRGNPDHPGSRGAFCIKGVHGPVVAREHPDRPLHPMRRIGARGEGKWERINWESAFTEIAERLGEVKGTHGPCAIAGAVSNHFVSRGLAMTQLLRSIGSPNYMINQDLCQGGRYTAAMLTGVGAQPGNEIERTRCILVVGKSPSDSSVVQWMHIKAAKQRGVKLIVIDPRRTQIARMADLWLQLKPGTDAALALGMINVMFAESLIDEAFVAQWCIGTERLRERASRYPLATVAAITGVDADRIAAAARLFATETPGCMVLGHGVDAQANGVGTVMAFHALLALTGNIEREGSNRFAKPMPGFKDYYSILNDTHFRMPADREAQIIGAAQFPFWSGPQSWSKSAHNPSLIHAIRTSEPYPVRALYVSGVNIVCTYPDIGSTIDALKRLDLLVVATDHVTPTAELADYLLPKTTLLEEEDVSGDPGGPCLAVVQRAVTPRGEARTDVEIAVGLRDALRARGLLDFELLPWNSHRELIDFQLASTGIDFDTLCKTGFTPIAFGYREYLQKGFKTPSGKIELSSERLEASGFDAMPAYRAPEYTRNDAEFDLVLLTGIRSMTFHHSRFRNHRWARNVQSAPELRIHPETAAGYGLRKGDWVWLETPSRAGRVLLELWLTEDMPHDVVATGMGWWYPEMSGADHGALTFNIDAALSYGPPWDPISGSPEARNSACRIVRADPAEIETLGGDFVKEPMRAS
ncbi:MAG: molybdopterin-dependent oxidoreductase [Proteobacteria bacterium]|nr:molybdopterin-dependent oxidoreductase [Burkholderiales bacterium]